MQLMTLMKCPMSLSANKTEFKQDSLLGQVYMIDLPSNMDERGTLTAVESNKDIPFEVRRIFYMHQVTDDRGGHAHIDTDQLIIPIAGSFNVTLFDGYSSQSYELNNANQGLFIPRMIFIELSQFNQSSVCLVLASDHYDITRSLRSRDAYLKYLEESSA